MNILNIMLFNNAETTPRLLGFNPSLDISIFFKFFKSKMLGFVRFLRDFWSSTRVRSDLLDSIGYRGVLDAIKKVGFCWISGGFYSNTHVRESQMI